MADILIFVLDPSKDAELEAISKGYRKDIYAKVGDDYFCLVFYEVNTLAKEYEFYAKTQGFYPIDNNICIVYEMNPTSIVETIHTTIFSHYFQEAKPANVTNLNLYPFPTKN